ncbi:MAG: phospholipase [Parvibaculum sp.]
MSNDVEKVLPPIMALLPSLLDALDALSFTARHFHPPVLPELVAMLEGRDTGLQAQLMVLATLECPSSLAPIQNQLLLAGEQTLKTFDGLRLAPDAPQPALQGYRALRHLTRAQEALYALVWLFPPISDFFLEAGSRQDAPLLAALEAADPERPDVGLMHVNNERDKRGGISIYVPEYYDPASAMPLIMALHGGSGHGRDFVWSWLRAARSHGAILVCPTSRDDTWSLMESDRDFLGLERILAFVGERWNIDRQRLLLTGMSDGGTFSYVAGLNPQSSFTHLAPVSASFHPFLLQTTTPARLKNLPIHITHGALDWMFPAHMAREANAVLTASAANCSYSEIADLSHTYPVEENAALIQWLNETPGQ